MPNEVSNVPEDAGALRYVLNMPNPLVLAAGRSLYPFCDVNALGVAADIGSIIEPGPLNGFYDSAAWQPDRSKRGVCPVISKQ